jgi:hypothetical protein
MTIERPIAAEIIGTWNLYKEETYTFGISVNTPSSELWVFYSDGTYTIDGGSTYNWSLANNFLIADSQTYQITKLYNGDMILRFNDTFEIYNQYYFVQ